ncbi:MAG TPA: Ig-like domain-containing protein, partial [Desulfobacteria bacterium]|nr:Ig-like domain-containing protein [Desulfobacteria bacterium]
KVGVNRVEFYVDGIKKGERTSLPYSFSWTAVVGTHTLTVKGYDAAGNAGMSSRAVKVQTAGTVNPSNGSVVSGKVAGISASFQDSIQGFALLYIDGKLVDSRYVGLAAANASFRYIWDTNKYPDGTRHVITVVGKTVNGEVDSMVSSSVTVNNS